MTLYLLAATRTHHEFATETAINDLGAYALVPRRVEITPAKDGKPERIEYRPLLPRMMFLACSESQWHTFSAKRLHGPNRILPPIRRELVILPRTWASFQDFAARAEQECEYRIGCHEAGKRVKKMKPGQIIRMINATIADMDLAGRMGRVVRMEGGKVLVQTDVMLMGKPVVARLDPGQITGMAAE